MKHHLVVRTVTLYKWFIRVEHFDGTPKYFNDVAYELIERTDVMGVECWIETKDLEERP